MYNDKKDKNVAKVEIEFSHDGMKIIVKDITMLKYLLNELSERVNKIQEK